MSVGTVFPPEWRTDRDTQTGRAVTQLPPRLVPFWRRPTLPPAPVVRAGRKPGDLYFKQNWNEQRLYDGLGVKSET